MGRQFHLYRLAFGRSAFQPPDKGDVERSKEADRTESSTQPDDISSWRQQYSTSGRPINPASNELRSNLQNAHDSILRTVGFSARDYGQLSVKMRNERRRQKAEALHQEQLDGEALIDFDALPFYLQLFCETGVKQRVQAFHSLSAMPLSSIIRSGVREQGFLSFIMTGSLSRASGLVGMRILSWTHRKLRRIGQRPWNTSIFLNCFNKLGRLLLAPFKIHEILCKLGCVPGRNVLPDYTSYKRYMAGLLGICNYAPSTSFLEKVLTYFGSNGFWVLLFFFVASYGYDLVGSWAIKYVTVFVSPGMDESQAVLILHSSDKRRAFHLPTFTDLVADDLRAIGWWSQRSWDRLSTIFSPPNAERAAEEIEIVSVLATPTRRSSRSTIHELPDDLREAMETMTLEDQARVPIENVLGRDAQLQDLLDPMPNDGVPASTRLGTRHQQSQAAPSPLAIELPSEPTEDESLRTIVSQEPLAIRETPPANQRGRSEMYASTADTINVHAPESTSTGSVGSSSRSNSPSRANRVEINATTTGSGYASLQFSIPVEMDRDGATRGFHVPSSSSTEISDSTSSSDSGGYVVVTRGWTKLREFPERALISMLSFHVTRFIMWPVEAIFVRNVALAFGPRGPWREDIIRPPFRPLLGWVPFFKQSQKTLLICAMPVFIGLAVWRLEYQYVWWCGTRRHNWRQSK